MSNMNIHRRTCMSVLAALVGGSALGAAPAPMAIKDLSCHRRVAAPIPAPTGTTLVLIDSTTPKDRAAFESLQAMLRKLLHHRRERVVLATFAGLAAGEFPHEVGRVFQEPRPTEALRRDLVISDVELLDNCLPTLWARNLAAVQTAITAQVASSPLGEYSEIAYALRWAALEVLPNLPTRQSLRVLVFSDGLLHSRSGQSFYLKQQPRPINVDKELMLLQSTGLNLPPRFVPRAFDLYWIGLGATAQGSKQYQRPADVEALKSFWSKAASQYGANVTQIGLTVSTDALK